MLRLITRHLFKASDILCLFFFAVLLGKDEHLDMLYKSTKFNLPTPMGRGL